MPQQQILLVKEISVGTSFDSVLSNPLKNHNEKFMEKPLNLNNQNSNSYKGIF